MPPNDERLEKFRNPPIAEVVCGIVFAPLKVDPLVLAPYRDQKKQDFPKHQLMAAIEEPVPGAATPFMFTTGVPPLRTWLLSADDSFIIQVQRDRFYLNWRRQPGREYPRFSDRDGRPGLLARTLDEFQQFANFCERHVGGRPVPNRVELAKVDHLLEGRDWKGVKDLGVMLPWLGPLVGLSRSETPGITVHFAEQLPDQRVLAISFESTHLEAVRVAKLETRASEPTRAGENLRDAFVRVNAELNDAFSRLIPKAESEARFNRGR